jgi:hypothetical protein
LGNEKLPEHESEFAAAKATHTKFFTIIVFRFGWLSTVFPTATFSFPKFGTFAIASGKVFAGLTLQP